MMKRILSVLTAAMLAFALSAPAFAASKKETKHHETAKVTKHATKKHEAKHTTKKHTTKKHEAKHAAKKSTKKVASEKK